MNSIRCKSTIVFELRTEHVNFQNQKLLYLRVFESVQIDQFWQYTF
jgi:hypothetical protein